MQRIPSAPPVNPLKEDKLGDQASHVVPNPLSIGSQATPINNAGSQAVSVTHENHNNPTYWQALDVEQMQHIPPAPPVNPP